MHVLVTGATGFVGRELAPALLAAGHEVVAATRRPGQYRGPGRAVELDLDRPSTVRTALEGCDAAYYLAHSLAAGGDFVAREARAASSFASAAAATGTRVVYLGGLGEGTAQVGRSAHLLSRHQVGAILREGAAAVELQAAVVIGRGSVMFEALRSLVQIPVLLCPDWVDTRTQPVGIDDTVRYLVAALDLPGGRYQIGGADQLTYGAMATRFARLTGRRVRLVRFPVLAPDCTAWALRQATEASLRLPGVGRPLPSLGVAEPAVPVALRLMEGLSVEVVVTDDRIRSLVPFAPVGFEEACRRALARSGDAAA